MRCGDRGEKEGRVRGRTVERTVGRTVERERGWEKEIMAVEREKE